MTFSICNASSVSNLNYARIAWEEACFSPKKRKWKWKRKLRKGKEHLAKNLSRKYIYIIKYDNKPMAKICPSLCFPCIYKWTKLLDIRNKCSIEAVIICSPFSYSVFIGIWWLFLGRKSWIRGQVVKRWLFLTTDRFWELKKNEKRNPFIYYI